MNPKQQIVVTVKIYLTNRLQVFFSMNKVLSLYNGTVIFEVVGSMGS